MHRPTQLCSAGRVAALAILMLLLMAAPAAANTFTVNDGGEGHDINPGDGVCDANEGPEAPCPLRAAVEEANAPPLCDCLNTADVINIDVPAVQLTGDVVLLYPATGQFKGPLAPFSFPDRPDLTLWVLPFSLEAKRIVLPETEDPRRERLLRVFKSFGLGETVRGDIPFPAQAVPRRTRSAGALPRPALRALSRGQAAGLRRCRSGSPASIRKMSARVQAGQTKVTVPSGACSLLQARPRASSALRRRPQPGQGGSTARWEWASIHRGWRSARAGDHRTRPMSACRNVLAASR